MKPQTTVQLLDRVKKVHKIHSDYALAKFLDVKQPTVSRWRLGKNHLDDDVALRVAQLLELDPGQVLAWVHAERCKSPEARRALLHLASLARTAVITGMTVGYGLYAGLGGTMPPLLCKIQPAPRQPR